MGGVKKNFYPWGNLGVGKPPRGRGQNKHTCAMLDIALSQFSMYKVSTSRSPLLLLSAPQWFHPLALPSQLSSVRSSYLSLGYLLQEGGNHRAAEMAIPKHDSIEWIHTQSNLCLAHWRSFPKPCPCSPGYTSYNGSEHTCLILNHDINSLFIVKTLEKWNLMITIRPELWAQLCTHWL